MIEIERAEATIFGAGNQEWETFLVVNSYKEAADELTKLINDNDAIGDFFRVVETGTPAGSSKPEPKPLAQYLAEYVDQEKYNFSTVDERYGDVVVEIDINDLKATLGQALDAYESTEGVVIQIIKKKRI